MSAVTFFTVNKKDAEVAICKNCKIDILLVPEEFTTSIFIFHQTTQHSEQHTIIELPECNYPKCVFGFQLNENCNFSFGVSIKKLISVHQYLCYEATINLSDLAVEFVRRHFRVQTTSRQNCPVNSFISSLGFCLSVHFCQALVSSPHG